MTAPRIEPEVAQRLRQASEWRLIGRLFERPAGSWWRDVLSLAVTAPDPVLAAVASLVPSAEEGTTLALMGPGGIVSPRETAHRAASDPGHVLAEIDAFYRAFAYEPRSEEPPDHVAVEAGFVSYLLLKEAHALSRGDDARVGLVAEAASRFRTEHVSVLADPLARALDTVDSGHLALAARVLRERCGPPPPVVGGWVPEGLAVDCPLICGMEG